LQFLMAFSGLASGGCFGVDGVPHATLPRRPVERSLMRLPQEQPAAPLAGRIAVADDRCAGLAVGRVGGAGAVGVVRSSRRADEEVVLELEGALKVVTDTARGT
jgi:hypothetical protein